MSPDSVEIGLKEENWHLMEPDDVFQALLTSEEGLTSAELERRRETYGLNEIREEDFYT